MEVKIEQSWKTLLNDEFQKTYFKNLVDFVRKEYQDKTCFPPAPSIFTAFDKCPVDKVKVVILGQDPYFNPGQAHGLCFSVLSGTKIPPSLVNIFKELKEDLGISPSNGDLTSWSEEGVLLLNATLTVESGNAGSHQNKGWEEFTDAVIEQLNAQKSGIVYFLWGSYAQKKGRIIDSTKNCVLKAPHPSPLSSYRGFFGTKPFSTTNAYLVQSGKDPIDWNL